MNLRLFAFVPLAPTIGGAFSPLASHSHVRLPSPGPGTTSASHLSRKSRRALGSLDESTSDNDSGCWNPSLRRVIGGMASMGVLETAFLTYSKISNGGDTTALCGTNGSCSSVLSGPYSVIPFTDTPLAGLGLVGYTTVALLALWPLLGTKSVTTFSEYTTGMPIGDTQNRIWLTAGATALGTFSVFLMSLLFGVLHESCVYCATSAALSIGIAAIVWFGGALPNNDSRQRGMVSSAGSFVTTVLTALVLFFTADDTTSKVTQFAGSAGGANSDSTTLLASSEGGFSPPPITTVSSERAMALSSQLQSLDARMYGAYWCSHCYDQKMAFGKEAFSKIIYIECDKDGKNSERDRCKKRDVPGFPTWEINGKLYPGEQALEELEEIISNAQNVNR